MAEYHLECPDSCTFKEGSKWGQKATEAILAGTGLRTIVAAGAKEGQKFSYMAVSRHKKHIVVSGQEVETDLPKATNIEILETIIQKGFGNSKNWKPTISDTMKAMDMWFRLTAGNPFDDLLDTLASASIGEETDPANGVDDETVPVDDVE